MANPEQPEKSRDTEYDAVSIQLRSQRPSDVFLGMERVRQWLKENPENQDVYQILLEAVPVNRELLKDKVRNLLIEVLEKEKSKSAEDVLANLTGWVQDLVADADDKYYAGEYEKAIQMYQRVLRLDPENERAKEYIAKAEIKLVTENSTSKVPRPAEQFYRRARSYVAARDVVAARNLFKAAVEAAQAKGVPYPDAEQALEGMENLIKSDEFRHEANQFFEDGKLKEAFSLYEAAINLDPNNGQLKKELESLQNLWFAENELQAPKVLMIFSSLTKWQNAVNIATLFISSENAKLKFVKTVIRKVQQARFFLLTILILGIIVGLSLTGMSQNNSNVLGTETPTILTLSVAANTNEEPVSPLETREPTPTITATASETPTVTPTGTQTLTPTQAFLGTGYIIKAFVSSWEAPNEKLIESLGLYQLVTVLEKKEVAGSTWYRCSWVNRDGQSREGWILGEYITFGTPPTPRP